ncbi:hypothetical protein GL218_03590 [Daldinia childiae]|uniref:uncharacterized protein n=1 Tax=Daldinia childiae TaxID=326645 RepID=UPI0014464AC3|nr:uncharacterized protein GL218_03590 [Daldinia childiae]KAF3060987.1 hypothetical protein GL218_03590 [Daldinia childiae]
MSKLWPIVFVPHAPLTAATLENQLMLQLGQYSDAVVKCGTSSWNVHLNIVATRCGWFEQQFAEARSRGSNEVVVPTNPYVAYKILIWIYTKTLDLHEEFKGFNNAIYADIIIWDMARQMTMLDLMKACQEKLKGYLRHIAVSIQRMKCNGQVPVQELFGVLSGIGFAYEKGQVALKNIFLNFVQDSQLWVLDVPHFQTNMATIPEFQKDVADLVDKSPGLRSFKPDVCTQCNKNPFAEEASSHYAEIKCEDGEFTAICYRCQQKKFSQNRKASDVVAKGLVHYH